MNKETVIVGLSGGVDSAVSALLLQQQGYDVRAVFMKNWSEDDFGGPCPWTEDFASAQAVAAHLGIPLESWNYEQEYRERVFAAMISEYRVGRTPNPDILCNREIKFDLFLKRALKEGDMVATGHYARTTDGKLFKGIDGAKDQSYFLAAVSRDALKKTLFPIGTMLKGDVRVVAKNAGLPNWGRPDSVGICFVGEKKMVEFLRAYIPDQPGDIVTKEGTVIGHHQGLHHLTIGQRHGFGSMIDAKAALKAGIPAGEPLFVVAKDIEQKTITVAVQADVHTFSKDHIDVEQPHWIDRPDQFPWTGAVKLRYRQADVPCTVQEQGNGLEIFLAEPQQAITPGQYAAFYDGDECRGCAVIR